MAFHVISAFVPRTNHVHLTHKFTPSCQAAPPQLAPLLIHCLVQKHPIAVDVTSVPYALVSRDRRLSPSLRTQHNEGVFQTLEEKTSQNYSFIFLQMKMNQKIEM